MNSKTALLLNILKKVKINHNIEILKEPSLKDAHIYCKINNLSGQITGNLIENFIKEKYFMGKNKSRECSGDLNINGKNIEIKTSLGGVKTNKFNYVQLRLNHDIDYYILTAYYLNDENVNNHGNLFIFKIDKENMVNLVFKYGGYAHGTKKHLGNINLENLLSGLNDREFCLRPIYNSKLWKELLNFRIDEITIVCV